MSKEEVIPVQGMHCVNCVMKIENAIKKIKGVFSASVDLKAEIALVEFNENETGLEDIKKAILDSGYQLIG